MENQETHTIYDENEKRINSILDKLLLVSVLIGPIMLLLRCVGIFSSMNPFMLCIYTIITATFWSCIHYYVKFNQFSRVTKYLVVIIVELETIILSANPTIFLFIAYLTAPILSSVYCNKKFTLISCIFCYICMIGSLILRGTFTDGPNSNISIYLVPHIAGATIEYLCCSIILVVVTGLMSKTIDKEHDQSQQISNMQGKLIMGIANLVESKDTTTGEHVQRTSNYVRLISEKMAELGYYVEELTPQYISMLEKAAPLHDIGKMYIAESILSKPGPLSPEELDDIQMHPLFGGSILNNNFSGIGSDQYTEIAEMMAICHHEWWNGQGYPLHLVGAEIPLCARIMAVADVLDALLSQRPYKRPYSLEETLNIIRGSSGTQFDPCVVKAVLELKPQLAQMLGE